jgi:hypothetical protein
MQKQIFAITIVTLFTSSALVLSATATPETRRHEAERYLQATPPKALFEDMADKMAMNNIASRTTRSTYSQPIWRPLFCSSSQLISGLK